MKWLENLICRHKLWNATEPIITELDGDVQAITWQKMECVRCGKVRTEAMLKPGEEVVIAWE